MAQLKSRSHQIPNGFVFYQPETGWKPPPFSSFDSIVSNLISHRKGNPFLIQQHGWSVDPIEVANEVEAFNVRVCVQMGWYDYLHGADGGGSAIDPFYQGPQVHKGKLSQLVAGGKTLVKWLSSAAEAVPQPLANHRAAVCAACPLNEKGDYASFFTIPVANAIRAAVEKRREMKLSTPFDAELTVCGACSCPLKLKVHMPIKTIMEDMPRESFDSLAPQCWIRAEAK